MTIADLKYPIGEFEPSKNITQDTISVWIKDIEQFPEKLMMLTQGLTTEQLQWIYRPGGWSIRQVIHHCADSHMNAITRFKLTLTEDTPTIKPYLESKWAALIDADNDVIEDSLSIIKGLHNRWGKLLSSMTKADLEKQYFHPQHNQSFPLKNSIGQYAWHCNHHLAHIKQALHFKNSFDH